jgi:hypothetical protein
MVRKSDVEIVTISCAESKRTEMFRELVKCKLHQQQHNHLCRVSAKIFPAIVMLQKFEKMCQPIDHARKQLMKKKTQLASVPVTSEQTARIIDTGIKDGDVRAFLVQQRAIRRRELADARVSVPG